MCIRDREYTVKVTDGKGIATGDRLAAGTYAFAAAWAGDDNYNIVTENGDFKVNKIDSSVAVNVNNIKVEMCIRDSYWSCYRYFNS